MLKALKFVQGAVSQKNLIPALTHFHIKDGRVTGSNGMVTLSCPIDLDLNIQPKATAFIKAIQTCSTTVQMSVTPAGKLTVKSGNFRAHIECNEEPYPEILPEGDKLPLEGGLLEALKKLSRFVGEDDSRRWARGILFSEQSAFATNNIILVQFWLGYTFPREICIPDPAIQELLRIGEDPIALQIGENSLTFHFEGEKWLRAQAYSTEWPPVTKLLDGTPDGNQKELPENFFDVVANLLPFTDELNRLYFTPNLVSTVTLDDAGANVALHVADCGIYNAKQLLLLKGALETIDLSTYPKPSLFYGDGIRGILVGIKL